MLPGNNITVWLLKEAELTSRAHHVCTNAEVYGISILFISVRKLPSVPNKCATHGVENFSRKTVHLPPKLKTTLYILAGTQIDSSPEREECKIKLQGSYYPQRKITPVRFMRFLPLKLALKLF